MIELPEPEVALTNPRMNIFACDMGAIKYHLKELLSIIALEYDIARNSPRSKGKDTAALDSWSPTTTRRPKFLDSGIMPATASDDAFTVAATAF